MSAPGKLPTWRDMHMDTTPEAEEILFEFWREAPSWQKLESMLSLNHWAQLLAIAGLQIRYPSASADELRRYLADIILGPQLAEHVYGPLPEATGDSVHD